MTFIPVRRRNSIIFAGLTAVVASGCYRYVPVDHPAPGTPVRIHVPVVTGVSGTNRLPESTAFDGVVVDFSDSLRLETKATRDYGAYRQITLLDTLVANPADLLAIEEKVLDRRKSTFMGVAVAGGVVGLFTIFTDITGGSTPPGGGGGGPGAAIVLSTVPSTILRILGR
ncbi:MAG: hypothetical protein OEZ65_10170 [Gemmatimonadota bacterium]|nr:hypothetical protein [Gemmatimonadota bacterium]